MELLVTGGAGYIGSATADALVQSGHSVTVYDSLATGHRQAVPEGARFVYADLGDREAVRSIFMTFWPSNLSQSRWSFSSRRFLILGSSERLIRTG